MEDNHCQKFLISLHCWRHGVMIWTGANYVGCFGNETLPHVFINAAFLILSHHNAIFLIDTFRIWMHITSCVNVYAFLSMYTMEPPPACWCFIVCSMVKVIASITRFIRWHSWIHGFITVIITSRITIIIICRIAPAICKKITVWNSLAWNSVVWEFFIMWLCFGSCQLCHIYTNLPWSSGFTHQFEQLPIKKHLWLLCRS